MSIRAGFRIQAIKSALRASSGHNAEESVSFFLAGSLLLSLCQAEAKAMETLSGGKDGVC